MTNEELEKKVETLTRVVGNQSVMLHLLKEKVQYIRSFQSTHDSANLKIHDLITSLSEWADECDEFFTSKETR